MEAYLALLRENPNIPPAGQIAERAGCSVRSVFERFPDLLALRIAATDFAFGQASGQTWAIVTEGDRQTRLRNHVERRAQVCEQWLPLRRILDAQAAGA
jgi:AcrR family transcriptional regulator